MNIVDLPKELQNKIFYFYAEHPCSKKIKDELNRLFFAFHSQKICDFMSPRETEVLDDEFRDVFALVYLSKITDQLI